ncbi:MAG: phosphoadenylyl-sulfate reductase [Xanthobacteraceae bacterium]
MEYTKNRTQMLAPQERERLGEEASALQDAELLADRLAESTPHQIIEAAAKAMPDRLVAVSSFGTESAVLLKFVADIDRSLPVLFLDTLWLFKETLAYRDVLAGHLGLTDLRVITPSPSELALRDPKRDLCFHDRNACCALRKVAPLARELAAFDGWISGRKRFHGGERSSLAVVEAEGRRLKFNPLARLSSAELDAVFTKARLPRHPLEALGFTSVGCIPCTARPAAGASARDGRWSGLPKTECGIHNRELTASNGAR